MNNSLTDIAFFNYEFVYKEFFWLLILVPLLAIWYAFKLFKKAKSINISSIDNISRPAVNIWLILKHLNFSLFLLGLSLIIISLARPHDPKDIEE